MAKNIADGSPELKAYFYYRRRIPIWESTVLPLPTIRYWELSDNIHLVAFTPTSTPAGPQWKPSQATISHGFMDAHRKVRKMICVDYTERTRMWRMKNCNYFDSTRLLKCTVSWMSRLLDQRRTGVEWYLKMILMVG